MKKLLPLILFLLTLTFAACAEEAALPAFEWERDAQTHWQLDENGAAVNQGGHEIGDMLQCTVCGSEILDWGDGCVDVSDYDENDNLVRYTSFLDGEMAQEIIRVYIPQEDGAILEKTYMDGVFYSDTLMRVNEDGETLVVCRVCYDGDRIVSEDVYDENGNCARSLLYDEDGSVLLESLYEYALGADGWYHAVRSEMRFSDGSCSIEERNEYGDTTLSRHVDSDGTVWLESSWEYGYQDGVMLWSRQYEDGALVCATFCNEEGACVQTLEFSADGSTVQTLLNEIGDPIITTALDPQGEVISQSITSYVYNDCNDVLEARTFVDGALAEERICAYDEDGWLTGTQVTTYLDDGGRTVELYDEYNDLQRVTVYDAEGSVISDKADFDFVLDLIDLFY